MIDLKENQDKLFKEMEKFFGVISTISKEERQAIIGLISLEEERLKDLLVNDTEKYANTVPKYIGYLKELAYNIDHADERYQKLKKENETLDTLNWWKPQKLFGNMGKDKDKAFAAMKLGIEL